MKTGGKMKKKLFILFICLLFAFSCKRIQASPLIMVEAEGIVDGYVGEDIKGKIVELKLTDNNYYFEVEDYKEVSDWFPNIPKGLEATVISHLSDNIHVLFEGSPQEEKDEQIKVAVPDGYIIDPNSGESIGTLENSPNDKAVFQIRVKEPKAEYERESNVKGEVGKPLEPQYVYVQLTNATCEASMVGHTFPEHNGLTAKAIDVLSSNTIVIEYTGTPVEEDQSLIHTLLLDADLKIDQDLEVADREDVRFNIIKKSAPARPDPDPIINPEPEPVTDTFVIPHTGIE